MSQEFLFVLWAGGGNVPPQLTLARRLVARGHRVRMLAPAVLRESIEAAGIAFEPYRETPEHDESVRERSLVRDFEARSKAAALAAARDNLVAAMARPVAADVLATLERRRADVVAFDFVLFGALFAAEKAAVPAAMLIHTIYPFPAPGLPPYGMGWAPMAGPLGKLRARVGRLIFRQVYERPLLPRFNVVRAGLGLEPLRTFDELIGRVDRALVLTSPAFDFPARLPANVEYVGPQLDPPAPTSAWQSPWPPGDDRPLVVVGLSTTHQAHDRLLERIVAALGTLPVRALVTTGGATLQSTPPANVHVAQYVPHARVLPQAAAVVTHAGLGTVHAALAHGLPLVCLPIGRDQPDNAARVEWHGAGLRLSPKGSPAVIRYAVERVLRDPGSRRRRDVSRQRSRRGDRPSGRRTRSRPWQAKPSRRGPPRRGRRPRRRSCRPHDLRLSDQTVRPSYVAQPRRGSMHSRLRSRLAQSGQLREGPTVARIEFDIRTDAPPEAIRAALLDFSERRPELWPGLPPDQYEVYEVGDTWAEIREGYRGRIWVRERYDWSVPGRVEFTAVDSGFATPGSYVVVDIEPAEGGGSTLHVTWERQGKGVFGKLFVGLMALTRGVAIRRSFEAGLARIAAARA